MYMSQSYLAQVDLFAGQTVPHGWLPCDGQLLQIAENAPLFSIIGTTYGGDGRTTFGLPKMEPKDGVPYYINVDAGGLGPREGGTPSAVFTETILFAGNFVIRGFAECNGQLLQLAENQELYAALGPGWPQSNATFALPNLTPPNEHMMYLIAIEGQFPAGDHGNYQNLVGTVACVEHVSNSDEVVSPNWVPADGRQLATSEYQELYSQIGTKYGGDDTNFKVPNIQTQNEYFRAAICTNGIYPSEG